MKELQIYNGNYGNTDIHCRNYPDAINKLHELALEESNKYDSELKEAKEKLEVAIFNKWDGIILDGCKHRLQEAKNWVKNASWTLELADKSTDDWKYKTLYKLTNVKLKQLKKINLF